MKRQCMQARTILAICGPSNAGKSQLARAVAALLGPAVAPRVPTDYFFLPRRHGEPLQAFLQRPLAYDWALLAERLMGPDGAERTTPDAEFSDFTRRHDAGGRPFTLRSLMIVDAMVPFPAAGFVVRLDVPENVRRARIVERDARWGTHVAANWHHLQATWTAAQRIMRSPNLVLDGECQLDANAAAIGRLLADRGWAK